MIYIFHSNIGQSGGSSVGERFRLFVPKLKFIIKTKTLLVMTIGKEFQQVFAILDNFLKIWLGLCLMLKLCQQYNVKEDNSNTKSY